MENQQRNKPNRTRNIRMTIRFTEEEYKLFKDKKEKSEYNNYADFVIRAIYKVPIYVFDTKPLLKTLTEISRIGNNINQLAKVANETGNIYENDVIELKKHLSEINNLVSSTLCLLVKTKDNKLLKRIDV